MPAVGLEPTISAGQRLQTYALDRAAADTGLPIFSTEQFSSVLPPLGITIYSQAFQRACFIQDFQNSFWNNAVECPSALEYFKRHACYRYNVFSQSTFHRILQTALACTGPRFINFPQLLSGISLSLFPSFCTRSFLPRLLLSLFLPCLFSPLFSGWNSLSYASSHCNKFLLSNRILRKYRSAVFNFLVLVAHFWNSFFFSRQPRNKIKGKVHRRRSHDGPEGKERHSSSVSNISALRKG
jgi:hypothetical protein